jgi:hypothetical protein
VWGDAEDHAMDHQGPQLAQVLCIIRQHQHSSASGYAAVDIAVVLLPVRVTLVLPTSPQESRTVTC